MKRNTPLLLPPPLLPFVKGRRVWLKGYQIMAGPLPVLYPAPGRRLLPMKISIKNKKQYLMRLKGTLLSDIAFFMFIFFP
jgi:hypothetical protein